MKQNLSIKKAIIRGIIFVNLPLIIVLMSTIIFSIILGELNILEENTALIIGVIFGITLTITIRYLLITKWLIWAFSNVRNVHELRRQAIRQKLLFETGSIFQKNPLCSKKDKLKLRVLEDRFNIEDIYEADVKTSKQTKIYFAFTTTLLISIALLIGVCSCLFLMFNYEEKEFYIGLFLGVGCLYMLKESSKKLINRKPQVTLNDDGITINKHEFLCWADIYEEKVTTDTNGSNVVNFLTFCDEDYNYTKIEIKNLNISPSKLENLLRTYRIRYNNNNKV